MNKLEEQLRASREREIPELRPPADGWAAISQQLGAATEGVATGAATAAANTKVSGLSLSALWKWIVGAVVLISATVLGLWYTGQNDQLAADLPARATRTEQAAVVPAGTNAAEVATAEPTKYTAPKPAVAPVVNAPVTAAAKPTRAVAPRPSPAPITPSKAAGTANLPAAAVTPAEASTPEEMVGAATDGTNRNGTNQGEQGFTDSALPSGTELTARTSAVATLPRAISPLTTAPADFGALPAVAAALPQFRKNGKPDAPAFWQWHGAAGYAYAPWAGTLTRRFARTPRAGQSLFILPTGELIDANPTVAVGNNSYISDASALRSWSARFGLNRQTRSGFLWRASFNAYYGRVRPSVDLNGLLFEDQLVVGSEKDELALFYELGVQYTFRKRKRFKPYLGLNFGNFAYYNGREERFFVDERTGLRGEVSTLTSSDPTIFAPEISATAGFQYQLNNQWSVGLSAWIMSQGTTFVHAPFHLEVRRTFGRRR